MESFYSQTYAGGKTIQVYWYNIFNHQETTSLLKKWKNEKWKKNQRILVILAE